jgi:hypothetical protein
MPQQATRPPTEADRRHVQQIIDRHAMELPEGVRRIEFAFGEDWTGYPAVYVNLFVDPNMQPTKEKIRQLNDYIKILHNDIIETEIGFWPYSRTFEDEQPR